ncbi:MAG: RHS repeat-associated core domain-containing protein, partial [Myxococcota bacterium]
MGYTTKAYHDGDGLIDQIVFANGDSVCYTYDHAGHRTTASIGFAFEPDGGPTCDVTEETQTTTWSYDDGGRLISLQDPFTGTTTYSYTSWGQLDLLSSDLGVTDFDYDLLGRLTYTTRPDGVTITHVWDALDQNDDKGALGQLRASFSSNGLESRTIEYDSRGRVWASEHVIKDAIYRQETSFDALGRRSQVNLPSVADAGVGFIYEYDGFGDIVALKDLDENDYWRIQARNELGQATYIRWGNGASDHLTFNPQRGYLEDAITHDAHMLPIMARHIDVDASGHPWKITDALNTQSITFGYDQRYRLTSRTVNDALGQSVQTMSYDRLGNILHKSDVGLYEYGVGQYGAKRLLKAGGESLTYDGDSGRVASYGFTTISYDDLERVTQMSRGTDTVSYTYGMDRIERTQGNVTRQLATGVQVEFPEGMPEELLNARYTIPGPTGRIDITYQFSEGNVSTQELSVAHLSRLGTMQTATNGLGLNPNPAEVSYSVWGMPQDGTRWSQEGFGYVSSLSTEAGFGTHDTSEQAFEVVDMGARVYSPVLGRFLSEDPVIRAGSPEGMNAYAYADNAPHLANDPSGRVTVWIDGVPHQAPGHCIGSECHAFGQEPLPGFELYGTGVTHGTGGPWALWGSESTHGDNSSSNGAFSVRPSPRPTPKEAARQLTHAQREKGRATGQMLMRQAAPQGQVAVNMSFGALGLAWSRQATTAAFDTATMVGQLQVSGGLALTPLPGARIAAIGLGIDAVYGGGWGDDIRSMVGWAGDTSGIYSGSRFAFDLMIGGGTLKASAKVLAARFGRGIRNFYPRLIGSPLGPQTLGQRVARTMPKGRQAISKLYQEHRKLKAVIDDTMARYMSQPAVRGNRRLIPQEQALRQQIQMAERHLEIVNNSLKMEVSKSYSNIDMVGDLLKQRNMMISVLKRLGRELDELRAIGRQISRGRKSTSE